MMECLTQSVVEAFESLDMSVMSRHHCDGKVAKAKAWQVAKVWYLV